MQTASLDHALWFHRPVRSDRWLLIDVRCQSLTGVRGLTIGHIFDEVKNRPLYVVAETFKAEQHG